MRSRFLMPLIAFGLLSLTSCSDTFLDPFENDGRYYSLYGFIDASETVHHLRVIQVTRFAEEILADRPDTRILMRRSLRQI